MNNDAPCAAAPPDAGVGATSVPAPSTFNSRPPPIPDHDLIRGIGHGAYGEVWLARHARLGTLRAVKIVRRDQFDDARPFQREFDGIRRYEPISRGHPNLVAILHVGGTDDCFFYVMELADSVPSSTPAPADGTQLDTRNPETGTYSPHTLRSELKRHGPFPLDRCLEIGRALAGALAHLHARSLVHRDVKPSNVIFVGGVAKLADIGLVAAVSDSRSYVGTEGYIPPEGPGAPSADCYALGKLLYELSTGHDRTTWPEPPADLPTRPDRERLLELNAILHKACAPDARERYRNAQEMRADLAFLQRGDSVKRKRVWEQRWAAGRKASLPLAVLLVFTVLGWWLLNGFDVRRHGRQAAQRTELPPMVGTTNLEAWKLFERGNVCFRQFTIEGEKAARALLTEAVRLDPNFVLAHNYLFACYVNSSALPYDEAVAGMRAMAKKLREVKPDSAEAYYAQAYVDFRIDLRFAEAERGFKRALQIDPSANARSFYGCYLVYMGRQEEARVQLRRMIDLDPAAPVGESLLGCSYYAERNHAQALFHFQRALELAPGYLFQHTLMGCTHEAMGDYVGALEHFQKVELGTGRPVEELRPKYDALRQAVRESGAAGYWRLRLERAQGGSNPEDQPYEMASILVQLGRKTEALDWLEKAYARRDGMDRLLFDHYWAGLRDEPRFQAMLKSIGYFK